LKKIYELIFVDHAIKINGQYNRRFSFLADAASLPTIKHAICLSFGKTTLHLVAPKTLATYSKKRLNRRCVLLKMTMLSRNEWYSTVEFIID